MIRNLVSELRDMGINLNGIKLSKIMESMKLFL